MAITKVGTATSASDNTSGGTTALSIVKPTGSTTGDLTVISVSYSNVGDIASVSGFSVAHYANTAVGGYNGKIFYKILDGTEGANFTIAFTSGEQCAATCVTYRGINTASPIDVVATGSSGVDSYSFSVDTNTNGAFVLLAVGNDRATDSMDDDSLTYTKVIGVGNGGSGPRTQACAFFEYEQVTAGSTPASDIDAQTSASWAGWFAIKPDTGGGSPVIQQKFMLLGVG